MALSAALAISVITLHLGVRAVLTGSMRPDYGPGAVLLTKRIPVSMVKTGMIVLFVPPGKHSEYAHRITSVTGQRNSPIITTKGDANKAADPWHARFKADSVPVVVATVPWLGRLMAGIRGPIQLTLIILGGLVAAISGARWILGAPPPAPAVQAEPSSSPDPDRRLAIARLGAPRVIALTSRSESAYRLTGRGSLRPVAWGES